jgi:hypothetical protein
VRGLLLAATAAASVFLMVGVPDQTFHSVAGVVALAVFGWVVLCVLLIRAFAVAGAVSASERPRGVGSGSLAAPPRRIHATPATVSTTGGTVRFTYSLES